MVKNEEHNIRRCLESVKWADEIIVLDTGSTDKTMDIAKEYTPKVFSGDWKGYGKSKQEVVNLASNDWILSVDADEEITTSLSAKIQRTLSHPDGYDGFDIKLESQYLGKWIRHSGWNHEYHLRLFNKNQGHFDDKLVHESLILNGIKGRINIPILHYPYPDLGVCLEKMTRYADYWAEEHYSPNKKAHIHDAVFHSVSKFIQMYFFQLGILDGRIGLILALNSSYSVFLKHIKLWEKHAHR
jgi:glycosyltransferase involved in cell wall biosynthesis